MYKKEIKLNITEQFKNKDIEKRKETLDKLFYKIIKAKEVTAVEVNYEIHQDIRQKRCIVK